MKLNKIAVSAVIWKEKREFLRSAKAYIFFTVIFTVVMQLMTSNQIVDNTTIPYELKRVLCGYSILYIALMSIPFFGSTLLSRIIYEERYVNAVHVLLATGINPSTVWVGKLLVTYFFSYTTFLISSLVYAVIMFFAFEILIVIELNTFILAFICMPLLSFGVMSIMGYLYWVLKNHQVIGMLFPIAFVMGVWNIAMEFVISVPNVTIILMSFGIGLALLCLSLFGVTRVTKDVITSVP